MVHRQVCLYHGEVPLFNQPFSFLLRFVVHLCDGDLTKYQEQPTGLCDLGISPRISNTMCKNAVILADGRLYSVIESINDTETRLVIGITSAYLAEGQYNCITRTLKRALMPYSGLLAYRVWIILGRKKVVGTLLIANGVVFLGPSIVVATCVGLLEAQTPSSM